MKSNNTGIIFEKIGKKSDFFACFKKKLYFCGVKKRSFNLKNICYVSKRATTDQRGVL